MPKFITKKIEVCLEAVNYNKLLIDLRKRHGYANEIPIALLIGSADSNFMKDNILQRINDYHHGSNHRIDFYFPGYGAYWHGHCGPQTTVCTIDKVNWLYSSKLFNDFIVNLENRTKWKYSGEAELILLNYRNGEIDYSEVLIFWLDKMVNEKIISSPANLFYKIFRKFRNSNSLEGISDSFTFGVIGEAIITEIINSVPLANKLVKGKHYCTKNISI